MLLLDLSRPPPPRPMSAQICRPPGSGLVLPLPLLLPVVGHRKALGHHANDPKTGRSPSSRQAPLLAEGPGSLASRCADARWGRREVSLAGWRRWRSSPRQAWAAAQPRQNCPGFPTSKEDEEASPELGPMGIPSPLSESPALPELPSLMPCDTLPTSAAWVKEARKRASLDQSSKSKSHDHVVKKGSGHVRRWVNGLDAQGKAAASKPDAWAAMEML